MIERCFLKSERIHLRPLESNDITEGYLYWFDDEEVCRHNGHHRYPQTIESMDSYIKNVNNSKGDLVLAIVRNEDDKHIGNISIQNIDFVNGLGEFAIIMGERDAWGKGYSKEAGKLIIDHVFNQLNLNKIYCGTSEHNKGMQALALSLGFAHEGTQKQHIFKNGTYNDVLLYGLLKAK